MLETHTGLASRGATFARNFWVHCVKTSISSLLEKSQLGISESELSCRRPALGAFPRFYSALCGTNHPIDLSL